MIMPTQLSESIFIIEYTMCTNLVGSECALMHPTVFFSLMSGDSAAQWVKIFLKKTAVSTIVPIR